jgi:maltose O-acetyltransferase
MTSQARSRSWSSLRRTLREDVRLGGFAGLVNGVGGSPLLPRHARVELYRAVGMRVVAAEIWPHVQFKTNQVSIGSRVFVNERCVFDNAAPVTIEDDVSVAMEVLFTTTTHDVGGPAQRAGRGWTAPITVRSGSWLGARATLLPGVTVGEGCVVASGAVVTADCLPHGLYGGVPARRLRDLPV